MNSSWKCLCWNGAGSNGPCPPTMSSTCLLPVENFSQRISSIREVRHASCFILQTRNSQWRLNKNNVTEHSQAKEHILWNNQSCWLLKQAERKHQTGFYSFFNLKLSILARKKKTFVLIKWSMLTKWSFLSRHFYSPKRK